MLKVFEVLHSQSGWNADLCARLLDVVAVPAALFGQRHAKIADFGHGFSQDSLATNEKVHGRNLLNFDDL